MSWKIIALAVYLSWKLKPADILNVPGFQEPHVGTVTKVSAHVFQFEYLAWALHLRVGTPTQNWENRFLPFYVFWIVVLEMYQSADAPSRSRRTQPRKLHIFKWPQSQWTKTRTNTNLEAKNGTVCFHRKTKLNGDDDTAWPVPHKL